jgi:TolB-like protein
MRRIALVLAVVLSLFALVGGKEKAEAHHASSSHRYRLGKAPKTEFKVGGKSYKIDAASSEAKRVRGLAAEEFDPLRRHERVEEFYRHRLHERLEDLERRWHWHCGPFRREFVAWVHEWPVVWRARWAWHHHHYFDEALWALWMAEADFAAEIHNLEARHEPVVAGYLPPDYQSTSPVAMYTDEYLNAAYNPLPFLAVLKFKSLKPDAQTDWIGKAVAESMTSRLSTMPGMFLAEPDQIQTALVSDPKAAALDLADPGAATELGRSMELEQVVVGSYVADGDKVLFNLRLVDVETGRVINGVSNAVPRDKLLESLPDMAASVAGWLNKPLVDAPPDSPVAMVPSSSLVTPSITPPVSVQPQPQPQPAAIAPVAPPAVVFATVPAVKHAFAADEKFPGSISWTAAEGPYQLGNNFGPAEGVKKYVISVGPGADIRGGHLHFGKSGHVEASGTPANPVIFRNVEFDQSLGGNFIAHYAVFDNCKFRKSGAFFSRTGYSSKWEIDHSLIRGSDSFKHISHVDYGIKFSDCTFMDVTFPEISFSAPKDKPLEIMDHLRGQWRTLDRCRFDACTIPPTIFWCAQASNYTRCKFIPGRAYESDTPLEVKAYVFQATGDAPDKVESSTPGRAAVHVTYVPQPFSVFAFSGGK